MMAELTVTIRESDLPLLEEIAEHEWRNVEQQASALLEQALSTRRRAQANPEHRTRSGRRNGAGSRTSVTASV